MTDIFGYNRESTTVAVESRDVFGYGRDQPRLIHGTNRSSPFSLVNDVPFVSTFSTAHAFADFGFADSDALIYQPGAKLALGVDLGSDEDETWYVAVSGSSDPQNNGRFRVLESDGPYKLQDPPARMPVRDPGVDNRPMESHFVECRRPDGRVVLWVWW